MENKATCLSLVIPCYNESANLPFIVEKLTDILANRTDVEVILVNNGSTDDSKTILGNYVNSGQYPFLKVVNVPVNQGYGFGILSGLRETKGEILAWTHADLQTDVCDVVKAYETLLNYKDTKVFIKGKRMNRRLTERFFTYGMQLFAQIILKTKLDDINAQPKMFYREFYDAFLQDAPYDFSLDLYVLYHAKKHLKIIEIPVFFNKRVFGEAKGGGSFKTRIKLIKRTTAYIFSLRRSLQNSVAKR